MLKRIFKLTTQIELPYLVGMILLIIMVYGVIINTLLQTIGITDPLSFKYIWPLYLLVMPLFLKFFGEMRKIKEIKTYPLMVVFLSILSPLLAAVGAITLNNTGNNMFVISSLFFVIALFIIVFFKMNLHSTFHLITIYSIALSLIFTLSLRSNYLVGWDIHQEYLVFQLTSNHNLWDMSTFRDSYNACLSITILPTILQNLTNINSLILYKVFFPFFLAIIPLTIYWIGSRLMKKSYAFAGAFAFTLQSQFINQLPALLRQGIAFIFFGLLIDLVIRDDISLKNRKILFFLYSMGLVISHYSTTYMAIAIFFLTKLILTIYKIIKRHKQKTVLSFPILLILILMTFSWNLLITNTSGGLVNTIKQIEKHIDESFTMKNKTNIIQKTLSLSTNNFSLVNSYIDESLTSTSNTNKFSKNYIEPISIDHINSSSNIKLAYFYFYTLIPWIFRLLIVYGILSLIINVLHNNNIPDSASMAISMMLVLIASIAIPHFSVTYNLERILQQTMTLLAPISFLYLEKIFKKNIKVLLLVPSALFLISYFLQTTGFVYQFILGSKTLRFANNGEQYFQYFTKEQEINSLLWLDKHRKEDILTYMDRYTHLRQKAYSKIQLDYNKYVKTEINPPRIISGSYVIAGNAATKENVVFTQYKNNIISYSFPRDYLDYNNNLIYSSSVSKIYK